MQRLRPSRKHCLIWPGFFVFLPPTPHQAAPHYLTREERHLQRSDPRGKREPAVANSLPRISDLQPDPAKTPTERRQIRKLNGEREAAACLPVSQGEMRLSETREGSHPSLSKRGRARVYTVLVCK